MNDSTLFPLAAPFDGLEFGPGRIVVVAGAPGVGKSSATMQLLIDALRLTPELRAVVANTQTSLFDLRCRQLSRLAGVDLMRIQCGRLDPADRERIATAEPGLFGVWRRLQFVERPLIDWSPFGDPPAPAPYTPPNIAHAVAGCTADVVLIDAVQEIAPFDENDGGPFATELRRIADAGVAVLCVSASDRVERNLYAVADEVYMLPAPKRSRSNGGGL